METTFGDYDLKRVKAVLDLPAFDNLAVRIAVLHSERDGYIKNTTPDVTVKIPEPFGDQTSTPTLGDDDETGMMLSARYTGENLIVDYKFDYTSQYTEADAQHVVGIDAGASGGLTKLIYSLQPGLGGTNVVGPAYRSSLPALTSDDHYMIYGHNLTAEYTFSDNLSVKSITAFRFQQQDGGFNTNEGNITFAPFAVPGTGLVAGEITCLLCSIAKRSQHQWSEELQVIGQEERFDYIGGLYFFDERAFQNDVAYILKSFKQVGPKTLDPGPLTPADYASGSLDRVREPVGRRLSARYVPRDRQFGLRSRRSSHRGSALCRLLDDGGQCDPRGGIPAARARRQRCGGFLAHRL